MAADELTRPLGMRPPPRKRPWITFLAIIIPPAALVAGLGFMGLKADTPPPAAGSAAMGETTGAVAADPPPVRVDTGPGLTEVAPDGTIEDVGGEVVISDPSQPQPIHLAAAPREDLVERSEYGLIPRIGDDGARPLDAYARPTRKTAGMIPIAIVVGGIGVEEGGTESALERLPGEVTLAIAPYGADLPRLLAKARSSGHEVLLQIPLEPYNYPAVDPGARTLTVEASSEENLDRLHWLMSRITTYVGVTNYMGARFTGEADALAPVLAEIGSRGLLYLDDGSSARSRVPELADGQSPVLQADIVLDADTTPAAIDARVNQLVAIAREKGFAIGTGTAFAATVDRIAAFAAAAEKRGIVLVPVSAVVQSGRT